MLLTLKQLTEQHCLTQPHSNTTIWMLQVSMQSFWTHPHSVCCAARMLAVPRCTARCMICSCSCFFANCLLWIDKVTSKHKYVGTSMLQRSDLPPRPFWEFLRWFYVVLGMYGRSGSDSDWEIETIRLEKVRRTGNSGRNRNSGPELTS